MNKSQITKNKNFKNKLNSFFKEKNINLYIEEYNKNYIKFSNDRELKTKKEVSKIIALIRNELYNDYLELIYQKNEIIGNQIYEKAKSQRLSDAGKLCQKLYGDKIRKNLNTGIGFRKGISHRGVPCTEENKRKLSENRKGKNNPMWGYRYSEEEKSNISHRMKEKILSGEFTPNTNNRQTHFDIIYDGIKFRSSWEIVFYYFNKNFLYEKLRIPYFDTVTNKQRIYIVDFVCHKRKMVIEIKPKELIKETEICKIKSLHHWCKLNGYKMKVYTRTKIKELSNNIEDFSEFEEETKAKILKI